MSTVTGPKGYGLKLTTMLAGVANEIVAYRVVKRGADADHARLGTANCVPLGIAMDNQDNINKGFPVAHEQGDLVQAEIGATVTLDALLESDANGRLVPSTVAAHNVVAIAREAATVSGSNYPLLVVELVPLGTYVHA